MKRCLISLIGLVLLCVSILGVIPAAADTVRIKVGFYDNYPKIFADENGKAAGFWPDIVNYIAAEENWNIEYVHGTWTECLDRLKNNEIDMMPDVAYTEERGGIYDFCSEGVYTSWSTVYVREGTKIESVLELEGKNVAVLKGSVNVEGPNGIKALAKAFNVTCTFIETDSYAKVMESVQSGTADAGVTSKDFGYQHKAEYGLIETPIIFAPSQLYFAFTKGVSLTPYLIEKIDYQVKTIKEDKDSVYYSTLSKWFEQVPIEKQVIPVWTTWTLIGIAMVVIVLGGGSYILRSQVQARTRELKNYQEHLEQLVKERTVEIEQKNLELERANIRLQEMDRMKSVFLASMSHELRTPLNSIIGFTGILLMGMSGELTDEQKKQLTMVKNSANHLLSLINDVLDISKIEAGKVELSPEEFKLKDVVKEVTDTFMLIAGEKGLELTAEVPEDITLFKDRRRTKQILMNFISNAMKFTERGSVKVIAEVMDEKNVRIRVIDTGVGIKGDEMGKLFQPFQQVDVSLAKKHEGTGLGLYLTKKLSNLLGGDVSVSSEYGKGSEFTVTIPLDRKEVNG